MMTSGSKKPYSLYLHVPFCRSICHYCDFCHVVYSPQTADQWLQAVEEEIQLKQIREDLRTIYIGGGTPTALREDQLDRLLSLLDPYRNSCAEYTAEVNPGTLTDEKARILSAHGVNRASIGMQAAQDSLLSLLGRTHTQADTEEAVRILRRNGIRNLSLDLMYSLPQQTMEMFRESMEEALRLCPDHISLYSLTIEENTVFGRKGYQHLDDETEADMYEAAAEYLEANGYHQYEISNFCLPEKESLHNSAYWNYEDFYGISCGASGKENHARYDHTRSLQAYIRNPLECEIIVLSKADEKFETVMMGLRLKKGMDEKRYEACFGETVRDTYGDVIRKLEASGMLQEKDGYLRCTRKGYPLLNEILIEFLT